MTAQPIPYETVLCAICGADDVDILLDALPAAERNPQDLHYAASGDTPLKDRLVRCRRCGLVYVSPRPQRQAIEQAYEAVDNSVYLEQGNERISTFQRSLRWLEKNGVRKGRLLDIGCAGGFFVKAAQDAGWTASGLEISRHLCEYGTRTLGVSIVQGTIERASFPEHSFDVISLWDVLEHVADPADTLRRVHRLLKPDGTLVLNVPDYGSIWARLLGRRWWFLIDVHIYYFTSRTLGKLLRTCGFEPGHSRMYFQTLRLGYLAQRVQGSFSWAGRLLSAVVKLLRLENVPITYYASQKTVIAKPTHVLSR